jgi:hypothetical protein
MAIFLILKVAKGITGLGVDSLNSSPNFTTMPSLNPALDKIAYHK